MKKFVNALGHELRFALRQIAWRPGFAVAMIITLALGIGATTAMFSVLHAVILSPLPYMEPDRLVSVWESAPELDVRRNVVNSGNYLDWRDENEVFDSIGAYSHVQLVALAGSNHPEYLTAITATPSLFETLGVHPVLGRLAAERDEVLISHGFWQSRFGADPDVIGALVRLDESPVTVTGVMPPGFGFPTDEIQVWRTLTFPEDVRESRRGRQWKVVARLKPGLTVEQAQVQMNIVADGIRERHPAHMDGWSVNVYPLHADVVAGYTAQVSAEGGVAGTLWVVMWVVGLTLLIACVNAAGLLLARLVRRRHELAVRKALGAGNRRLVLGVFSECAVYTVIGAAAGIALAYWLLAILIATAPSEIPRLADASINPHVLAFGCLLAFMAIGIVGLVPALAAAREDAAAALADGTRPGGAGRTNWRRSLIATEVALACVLTAGALLLTHNLIRLLNVDPGHEIAGIQVVTIPLSAQRIGETDAQVRFHEQVMDRLRAQPGVIAVSGTAEPPLVGHQMTFSYFVEGAPAEFDDAQAVRAVHPEYFRTLGQAVHAGRGFTPDDRMNGIPVAVVNEAFARRNWPGGSAIGKRIAVDERGGPWIEIVGVVADTRHDGPMRESVPAIYLPFAQKPWWWMSWTSYVVRVVPGATLAEDVVREAVWAVDPDVAVGAIQSLESIFAASTARARLATALLGGFGILALILSAVGIYSVVAFSVAQREREFGVRMAMGANRGAILRCVVGWGLTMAFVGVGAGLLLAFAFAKVLASQLHMISPLDPVAFSLMLLLIVGTALLACLVPGLRAARLDPMVALREE